MTAPQRDVTTLARGGALNLAGIAAYGALGFGLVVAVTRGLDAGSAGAFFEAVALFNILNRAVVLGADLGVVRFVARSLAVGRSDRVRPILRTALRPVVVMGVVAGVALFALAGPFARVFGDARHEQELARSARLLAPFLVVGGVYGVLEAATRAFGTMVPSVAVERVGRGAVQLLLVLVAIALGGRVTPVAIAWVAPYALGAVALAVWLRRLVRRVEARPPTGADADDRGFWAFTAPRALASVFHVTVLWLDVLLVGALASVEAAGVYAAATRYLLLGTMAGQALGTAIQPQVSGLLATGSVARARGLFQVAAAWTMAITWPIFLTIIVFAEPLLRLLGPRFVEAHDAIVVLGLAWLFAAAVGPVDVVLLMAGRSRTNLANTAAALVANVTLNLLLVPDHGITGAAIAWAASIVINNGAPVVQVWRLLSIHPFGRGSAVVAVAATVAFGGVGVLVREGVRDDIWGALLAVVLGGATYLAVLVHRRATLEPAALRAAVRRRVSPASDPSRRFVDDLGVPAASSGKARGRRAGLAPPQGR